MEKVLSMNAGNGDYSYAQNSTIFQKTALLRAKPWLEESIRSWKSMFECETLCIADLGCSSGPNALLATQIITSEIRNKYTHKGIRVPELQIFFNDLPSTDFNTLFKLIFAAPPAEGCYLVAGVPGSFHNRLFPSRSIHFIHSSISLHWLSRIPPEIEDKKSKWWNRGRIHMSEKGPPEIGDLYFAQFQKDFNGFLRARAEEVVEGGRMFLVIPSADRRQPSFSAFIGESLGFAIQDLVSQGIVEEEKLDSFNLPIYTPSEDELRSEVNKEGSFTIVRLEFIIGGGGGGGGSIGKLDDIEKGKLFCKQIRAGTEGLISYHFGEKVVETIFHKYGEILGANIIKLEECMKESYTIALTLERNVSI